MHDYPCVSDVSVILVQERRLTDAAARDLAVSKIISPRNSQNAYAVSAESIRNQDHQSSSPSPSVDTV